jgi:hypothetical protein
MTLDAPERLPPAWHLEPAPASVTPPPGPFTRSGATTCAFDRRGKAYPLRSSRPYARADRTLWTDDADGNVFMSRPAGDALPP